MKKTGFWLRELRIFNGLTQKQAAELFETKRGTYSAWESKYKKKILPKSALENNAIYLLIVRHPVVPQKRYTQGKTYKREKNTILRRIIKWIARLKNLLG